MCGIFCAVSLKERFEKIDFDQFESCTNLLNHRGPDSQGIKSLDTFSGKDSQTSFNIFLGHKRLAIIDLSALGHQPMVRDNLIIIFNGEIFNYVELREELISKGYRFESNTDTEVIIHLYKDQGSSAFKKLNGMWALVLVDLNKNKIIVSRDRFSIKPAFILRQDSKIFFASEIKALLPLMKEREINYDVMSNFLFQGLLDKNEFTFIKGIEKIKAKTNLIIDLQDGKLSEEQYWEYEPAGNLKFESAFDEFYNLLTDSVKIRLRSDVPIGALLSGGLDSSSLSVIANNVHEQEFKTFSVVSDIKKYSEEEFVDELVRTKKIKNEKLFLKVEEIIKNFDKVLSIQDEPFISFIVAAHYTILEKIKKETDITVILSGQGGDEILLGYLRFFFFYLKDLKKNGKYIRAAKELFASLIYRTVITQYSFKGAKRYLPSVLLKEKNFLRGEKKLENTWEFNSLRDAQLADIDKFSVPILTRYEDRNSMAHSLEIRLPFLDYRLVDFMVNLSTEFKIRNGWNKYILRKTMSELPDKIRWRRDKKGFILPEEKWLKQDLKEDIINAFSSSILDELGYIDKTRFIDYYNSYLNGNKWIHHFEIARVYIAEKWARKFIYS